MTTMSDALNRFWYVPTSNTNLCALCVTLYDVTPDAEIFI